MSLSVLEQQIEKLEEQYDLAKKQIEAIEENLRVESNPATATKLQDDSSRRQTRLAAMARELQFLKDQVAANQKARELDIPSVKVAIFYKQGAIDDQNLADFLVTAIPAELENFAPSCLAIPISEDAALPNDIDQFQGIVLVVSDGLQGLANRIASLQRQQDVAIAIASLKPGWKPPIMLHVTPVDFSVNREVAAIRLANKLSSMQAIALKQEYAQHRSEPTDVSLEDGVWKRLLATLERHKCIPIIGPDFVDSAIVPTEKLLVEKLVGAKGTVGGSEGLFKYDLAGDRPLARVLEYLMMVKDIPFRAELIELLVELRTPSRDTPADADDATVGHQVVDVNAILAALPFEVYVTVNQDNLLEEALRNNKSKKKRPQPVYVPYISPNGQPHPALLTASEDTPAVVYLMGMYQSDESEQSAVRAVESEYLELIHEISGGTKSFPEHFQIMLKNNALLFLGFDIHHIAFQTIYWMLYPHIRESDDLLLAAPTISPLAQNGSRDRVSTFLRSYLSTKNMITYINSSSGHDSTEISNAAWFLLDLEYKWRNQAAQ